MEQSTLAFFRALAICQKVEYVSVLAELRANTVRDVASYEAVFWFSELPCEKECYTPAWDGGETTDEENWLRIDKPVRPVLPRPPA